MVDVSTGNETSLQKLTGTDRRAGRQTDRQTGKPKKFHIVLSLSPNLPKPGYIGQKLLEMVNGHFATKMVIFGHYG